MGYLLFSCIFAISVALNCQAIQNGDVAIHFLQFPWHVHLSLENLPSRECGGALISDKHVLTSAYCVFNSTIIRVTIGSLTRTNPAEMLYTTNYNIHPDYIEGLYRINNIATVELPTKVISRNRVRFISLPTNNQRIESFENVICYLPGFGSTDNPFGQLSSELKYANQAVISNELCAEMHANAGESFNPAAQITNTIICASSAAESSSLPQGICQFDEGGALVAWINGTWTQIGIASQRNNRFRDPCNTNFPQIYTRITPYLEWISDITGINLITQV